MSTVNCYILLSLFYLTVIYVLVYFNHMFDIIVVMKSVIYIYTYVYIYYCYLEISGSGSGSGRGSGGGSGSGSCSGSRSGSDSGSRSGSRGRSPPSSSSRSSNSAHLRLYLMSGRSKNRKHLIARPRDFWLKFFFWKFELPRPTWFCISAMFSAATTAAMNAAQEMLKGVGFYSKIVESVKATEREATSADAPLLPVAKEDFSDVQLGRDSDFVLPVASSLKVRSSDDHATPKEISAADLILASNMADLKSGIDSVMLSPLKALKIACLPLRLTQADPSTYGNIFGHLKMNSAILKSSEAYKASMAKMPEGDELVNLLRASHGSVTSSYFSSFSGYANKLIEKIDNLDMKIEQIPERNRTANQTKILAELKAQKTKFQSNLEAHMLPIQELMDEMREKDETGSIGTQAKALLSKDKADKVSFCALIELVWAIWIPQPSPESLHPLWQQRHQGNLWYFMP